MSRQVAAGERLGSAVVYDKQSPSPLIPAGSTPNFVVDLLSAAGV